MCGRSTESGKGEKAVLCHEAGAPLKAGGWSPALKRRGKCAFPVFLGTASACFLVPAFCCLDPRGLADPGGPVPRGAAGSRRP